MKLKPYSFCLQSPLLSACPLASPAALTLEKPQLERSSQRLKSPFRSCCEQKYFFGTAVLFPGKIKHLSLFPTPGASLRGAQQIPCTCWDWKRFKQEKGLSKAALNPALVHISGDLSVLPRLTGNNPSALQVREAGWGEPGSQPLCLFLCIFCKEYVENGLTSEISVGRGDRGVERVLKGWRFHALLPQPFSLSSPTPPQLFLQVFSHAKSF